MKINERVANEYLTVGRTYDNYVFENCSEEFLSQAKERLSNSAGGVKPCCVSLTKENDKVIEQVFKYCSEDFQKKLMARDYVVALIMRELLAGTGKEEAEFIESQIEAFNNNYFDTLRSMHAQSFMPHDVKRVAKDFGKIELNVFLHGSKNKVLQQAVNIFISAREPYSVKLFTSQDRLSTYYDIDGNIIECPHDFMRRDARDFIVKEETEKGE